MCELFLAVYVIVSTYYLVGIIHSFNDIERADALLRRFLRKCQSAKLFAMILIFVIAYSWPIGMIIKPMIRPWVRKFVNIDKLPVNNVTRVRIINTPVRGRGHDVAI